MNPTRRLLVAARCLPLLGSAACATMIHGTTQDIPIYTPVPAVVAIDGIEVGTAPMTATVSRRRSHVVRLTADSAPPVEVQLKQSMSGWVLANAFIYYLPAAIDVANGAAYKFKTKSISVSFPTRVASAALQRAGLTVRQEIRFTTAADAGLIYASVDSATSDRLYVHTGGLPTSVAMDEIQRLDIAVGGDRWAPREARRMGSPLLVDDKLRLSLAARDYSVEGRLVTMDSARLIVNRPGETMRLDRRAITLVERREGHDYGEGAIRGLIVGGIVGGLIAAQAKGSMLTPDGPSLMRGGAIGAVLGLSLTPALAPGKWVRVRKW